MNILLNNKKEELDNSSDYECWYLVKQPTEFDSICYLVSFLKKYKEESIEESLSSFIEKEVNKLNNENQSIKISNNYRALRVAAFFGLIKMTSSKYENAEITDVYYSIEELCEGKFENKNLYKDIIKNQIEKFYVTSSIDEAGNSVREKYEIFPVMLLYKVLLELGKTTEKYFVSLTEYRYLVATTKRYEDYLDTLLYINLMRYEKNENEFEIYRSKFDNRFNNALKQLEVLNIDKEGISLNPNYIKEVSNKIFIFENNIDKFNKSEYLDLLCSNVSLFDYLEKNKNCSNKKNINENLRVKNGKNILYYGVPGSGKSHTIEENYGKSDTNMIRVVFHPDYMNTDFIGQILPTIKDDDTITYEFTSGPFTNIMKKAYEDYKNKYYLVIEEINRGNAPAIFGDVFQLLDRDNDGYSKYGITNFSIAEEMYGKENRNRAVKIPSNLTILATMNTADQNVFTLDTAFQRRWNMKMIKNDVLKAEHASKEIVDTGVIWSRFNMVINNTILDSNVSSLSSEDKRLGAYFITPEDLRVDIDSEEINKENDPLIEAAKRFSEKVIKYLWDDAFKFSRDKLFDISVYKSLEDVISDFTSDNIKEENRFDIFRKEIRDLLLKDNKANEETDEE